jgi:hypothetical protein
MTSPTHTIPTTIRAAGHTAASNTPRSTRASSNARSDRQSAAARWGGRLLTGIPVAFLVLDGAMKLANVKAVADAMPQLGWPAALAAPLGIILLTCVAAYLIPQTAVLGAILLTGYLGGAVATHVRVGNPLFSHVLFPTYIGAMIWGGLFLRDARVRALIPFRGTNE